MKSFHTLEVSLFFGFVPNNSGLGMLPVLSSCSTMSLLALQNVSSIPGHQKAQHFNMEQVDESDVAIEHFPNTIEQTFPLDKLTEYMFFFLDLFTLLLKCFGPLIFTVT